MFLWKSQWKMFIADCRIPCFYRRYLHITILQALYLRFYFKSYFWTDPKLRSNASLIWNGSYISDGAHIVDCCCNFNIFWFDYFHRCNNTYGIVFFILVDIFHQNVNCIAKFPKSLYFWAWLLLLYGSWIHVSGTDLPFAMVSDNCCWNKIVLIQNRRYWDLIRLLLARKTTTAAILRREIN